MRRILSFIKVTLTSQKTSQLKPSICSNASISANVKTLICLLLATKNHKEWLAGSSIPLFEESYRWATKFTLHIKAYAKCQSVLQTSNLNDGAEDASWPIPNIIEIYSQIEVSVNHLPVTGFLNHLISILFLIRQFSQSFFS